MTDLGGILTDLVQISQRTQYWDLLIVQRVICVLDLLLDHFYVH